MGTVEKEVRQLNNHTYFLINLSLYLDIISDVVLFLNVTRIPLMK